MQKSFETGFYGIYVLREGRDYWLMETGSGGDECFDHYPTPMEIQKFRDEVVKG